MVSTSASVAIAKPPVQPSVNSQTIQNRIELRKLVSSDKQFIHLYVTYIYLALVKHHNTIVENIGVSRIIQTELFSMMHEVERHDPELYQRMEDKLSELDTCTTACEQIANEMVANVTNCKVGVTMEDFATWNSRAQTFSLVPKSYRAECINIEKTKENSDCIEKLAFSILANIGLKVPTTRVKSNQAEFFRVFVQLKDKNELCDMMPTIQTIIDHCAAISLKDFEAWKVIYARMKLHNKDMSKIKFDKKTVDTFFTIDGLKIVNYNTNMSQVDEPEDSAKGSELVLDCIERAAVQKFDKPLHHLEQKRHLRGLDSVTARWAAKSDVTSSDSSDNSDSEALSEHATCGIFYTDTAYTIATNMISKITINSTFTLCIVGVHCVVSLCRLMKALFDLIDNSNVVLVVNVIDVSQCKLDYLRLMVCQYKHMFTVKNNFRLTCIASNFLLIKNEVLQINNVIITFLHQSVDECFALKFALLQYFCSPSNQNGLQLLLFTGNVVKQANEGSPSESKLFVSAEKKIVVGTYRPAETEAFVTELRDLFSFKYVKNIYPDKQIDTMKYWDIWKALKEQSELKCGKWLLSKLELNHLLDDEFVLKHTNDLEDPILNLSSTQSKRIDIVVKLKDYLTDVQHDADSNSGGDVLISVQKARLNKLDQRTRFICYSMFETSCQFYSTFLSCCGLLSSDFCNQNQLGMDWIKSFLHNKSGRKQSEIVTPDNAASLCFKMVWNGNKKLETLQTWTHTSSKFVFNTLMEDGSNKFSVTFPPLAVSVLSPSVRFEASASAELVDSDSVCFCFYF